MQNVKEKDKYVIYTNCGIINTSTVHEWMWNQKQLAHSIWITVNIGYFCMVGGFTFLVICNKNFKKFPLMKIKSCSFYAIYGKNVQTCRKKACLLYAIKMIL